MVWRPQIVAHTSAALSLLFWPTPQLRLDINPCRFCVSSIVLWTCVVIHKADISISSLCGKKVRETYRVVFLIFSQFFPRRHSKLLPKTYRPQRNFTLYYKVELVASKWKGIPPFIRVLFYSCARQKHVYKFCLQTLWFNLVSYVTPQSHAICLERNTAEIE